MKTTGNAIITGMVLFLIFFVTLPVLQATSGWNDTAGYATLYKILVPVGIALYVVLSTFGIKGLGGSR